MPTVDQIVNEMFIGSVSPEAYEKGTYEVRNITTSSPAVSPTASPAVEKWAGVWVLGAKGHCLRSDNGVLLDQCWSYTAAIGFYEALGGVLVSRDWLETADGGHARVHTYHWPETTGLMTL